MEIKIMEEKTEIIFKNNSIFIGIYIVSLITIISLAISKISVQSIIFHLIFFTFFMKSLFSNIFIFGTLYSEIEQKK